ncbi:MAG: hypothetical protein ACLGH8_01610 [Bacteroidia bacterium]
MKKILTVVALSLLLFSCSKEEGVVENQNALTSITAKPSGNVKIDDLYQKMLDSKEYIKADSARKIFAKKVKFKGSVTDIDTTTELLAWIGSNLSSTEFKSLAEAENELNNVHALSQVSYNANLGLYQLIGQQPNPGQVWSNLTSSSTSFDPDACGCLQQFVNNLTLSQQYYSEELNDWYNNGVGTRQAAEDCHELMVMQDAAVYGDCLSGCDD